MTSCQVASLKISSFRNIDPITEASNPEVRSEHEPGQPTADADGESHQGLFCGRGRDTCVVQRSPEDWPRRIRIDCRPFGVWQIHVAVFARVARLPHRG